MVLKGETVSTGASIEPCDICGSKPTLGVRRSAAGYYIGYACCSPYSRETDYFKSHYHAKKALEELKNGEGCDKLR